MIASLQPLMQFLILFAIGCFSLLLALFFYLKFRALQQVSANSSINVYNKTFNVISPYPGHRLSMHGAALLVPFALVFAILVATAALKIFEMGLAISVVAFLIWLSLLMVDSAIDMYKSANVFLKAFEDKVDLGKGDLVALFFLKKIMPRLSAYYLLIAVGFFIFSFVSPQIVPRVLYLFSQSVGPILAVPAFLGIAGAYAGPLAVAIVTVILVITGGAIKNRILGSVPAMPLTLLEEQFISGLILKPELLLFPIDKSRRRNKDVASWVYVQEWFTARVDDIREEITKLRR